MLRSSLLRVVRRKSKAKRESKAPLRWRVKGLAFPAGTEQGKRCRGHGLTFALGEFQGDETLTKAELLCQDTPLVKKDVTLIYEIGTSEPVTPRS